jgi:hypothetical protein
MAQPRHVVFFGASVTEQHVHSGTGELSGFVTYFERHFAAGLNLKVSRVSAGSSDLTDAAMVYVEEVIALKPDICILDWATPALTECDPRFIHQIYFRLMAHDILPVTVIFPRGDRAQRDIPITREMSGLSQAYDLPFYDMTPLLKTYGMDVVLRDVVHTTAEGARIYAEAVAALIPRLPPRLRFAFATPIPFCVTALVCDPPPPDSFRKITVTNLAKTDEPVEFTLVMQQRVGPYSPVLDVRSFGPDGGGELPPYPLWDVWCHRERQTAKKIMHWHKGPFQRIEIGVSRTDPDYATSPESVPVDFANRRIRQRGTLFLISDTPQNCSVSYA